jgi:hypothetical protein
MGFQIRNKEGQSLTIKELDQEASTFWGVENDPEYYASPIKPDGTYKTMSRMMSTNWYDNIGYIIHKLKTTDWEVVKEDYLSPYKEALKKYEGRPDYEEAKGVMLGDYVKAMCDLIDLWKSKGYQPEYVNG